MLKIAKDFYDNHHFLLDNIDDFFKSDLAGLMKMMYGTPMEFNPEYGLLKIQKTPSGKFLVTEHVFYDYTDAFDYRSVECGFFNIKGLKLKGTRIINTQQGKELSEQGFTILHISPEDQLGVLEKYLELPFKPTNDTTMMDPTATFKFNTAIWNNTPKIEGAAQEAVYWGIKKLYDDFVNGNQILESLDSYDLNVLQWKKGRAMTPHNGVDYRSMINMITYNTFHCSETRNIYAGKFDWYDVTFKAAFMDDYEDLVNIQQERQQLLALPVDTSKALILNVFSPRYYHEVGEFKGEGDLYVCTSNQSFRAITDNFDFKW